MLSQVEHLSTSRLLHLGLLIASSRDKKRHRADSHDKMQIYNPIHRHGWGVTSRRPVAVEVVLQDTIVQENLMVYTSWQQNSWQMKLIEFWTSACMHDAHVAIAVAAAVAHQLLSQFACSFSIIHS